MPALATRGSWPLRVTAPTISLLIPLLLGAVTLPAHVALADEIERTMALVEVRTGEDLNPLTADYLQEVLVGLQKEAHGDVMVVPMAKSAEKLRRDRDQVPTALTPERRSALETARKQGIKYLDNADAANAIKSLQAAEAKYRAAIAIPGADEKLRKDYLDVLAQLATAHVIARDKDAAMEVFRTVVTAFGAKANVTDDNYRPDVVELYRKAAKEAASQPKGQLEVNSDPPGAHVLVNGIDRGVTPAVIADLAPGLYAIRLQAGPASSMLHRVKVAAGSKAKLIVSVEHERHLLLDETRVGLGYPDLDGAQKRVLADAVALGKELDVASVAAVGVLDGSLYAWLVDVAQARIERSSNLKVPGISTSPRAVAKVLNTLLGERKGAEGPEPGEGEPKAGAWYTSVPGIVCGIGALAALGVGAGYAGNFSVGPVDVSSQAEKDKMQTGRVIAGVGLGTGVLLAGAAAFFFWRQGQASTPQNAAFGPRVEDLPPPQLGFAPAVFASAPGR
jgi:hypothetical protein